MNFSVIRKLIGQMDDALCLYDELERFPECNLKRAIQSYLNEFLNSPDAVDLFCDPNPGFLSLSDEEFDKLIERFPPPTTSCSPQDEVIYFADEPTITDYPITYESPIFNIETDGSLMDRLLSIFGVSR